MPRASSSNLIRWAAAATFTAGVMALTAVAAHAANVTPIPNARPGTATLLLHGPIATGDTRRMVEALDRIPEGTSVSVILESPGGVLGEGLRLGALFHDRKISTFVRGGGAICYSACALAFLGGRDARTDKPLRVKMSGGKLGFHQFSRRNFDPLKIYTKADYDGEVATAQEITRDVVRYLKHIGEDLSKLQLMLRAPADGMNIIGNDECLERGFHVLDEASDRLIEPGRKRQRVSALN